METDMMALFEINVNNACDLLKQPTNQLLHTVAGGNLSAVLRVLSRGYALNFEAKIPDGNTKHKSIPFLRFFLFCFTIFTPEIKHRTHKWLHPSAENR